MSGRHCFCADECRVTSCKDCLAPIPEADKRRIQHDLCLACKAAMIPGRLRFKAGDRVVMPASPNALRYHPDDPIRTGFRGVVEGWIGHCLTGLRDDGLEWCEQPGNLDPEPAVEQLALFEDKSVAAKRPPRKRRGGPRRTAAVPVPGGAL